LNIYSVFFVIYSLSFLFYSMWFLRMLSKVELNVLN